MPVSVPHPTRLCFCKFELDLTSGELHAFGLQPDSVRTSG